jgi:signal transduction histidine kinase
MDGELARLQAENEALRQALAERSHAPDPELEALKSLIVNNVTHELRTPLLQLKAGINSLTKEPSNRTALDIAETATARLEEVVQNIAGLAQSHKISPDLALVSESVDFARRWLKNSWKHKDNQARVIFELPASLPPVLADKKGIGNVLQLLIDNALKFSDKPIKVTARREGACVRVGVRDLGIGIPEDQYARILEPFVQLDGSSTRRYGGAGVGLTLVKMILDRHDTQLTIESAVGRGSTFSFTLKVVDLKR